MDTQTSKTIPVSDYEKLIKEGITNARGTDKALELLTVTDLTNLGKTLADRQAKIADLFSVVVHPINNLKEGIEQGRYNGGVYDWIKEDYSRVPLVETKGAKRVYFVPVTENVTMGEEEAYVEKFGLTLCKNAPNYLLGVMAQLKESDLPGSLFRKDIVATENTDASVFRDKSGVRCFLGTYRHDGGRGLDLVGLDGGWDVGRDWVFLAERP